MSALVHEIPGRLRFVIPSIKRNEAASAALCGKVQQLPGVVSVKANHVTGSLLVEHDGAHATRSAVFATLEVEDRMLPRETDRLAGKLANALIDRLVERMILAAVTAVI